MVRVLVRTNAAAISLHASLGEMLGMGFKSKSKQEEKTLTIQCIEANPEMDTLGIEPRASRMLSGCDTTTPCAQ